ncbi:UNVERIFIED_CONTAM: hypothetical protein RMT77_019690 [Armadillidium vulgare]|jgi:transposase-like protein
MERWSGAHRAFAIEAYLTSGKSYAAARRKFCSQYNIRRVKDAPSINLIKKWMIKFRETGSALNIKLKGPIPSVSTEENVQRVSDAVNSNPRRSLRKHAAALGIKKSTLHNIVKKKLSFHPYKIQIVQALKENDYLLRKTCAERILAEFPTAQRLGNIFFSDEAHFHLEGYVNKQNCRYWAPVNPKQKHQRQLHSPKVTVWCAMSRSGIIGPYFFEGSNSASVTVNSERYVNMIETYFRPIVENDSRFNRNTWFQQDGATAHTARAAMTAVRALFPQKLISRFGDLAWPPRSPDITPCDYFLWGYLKSRVYVNQPRTITDLKRNIQSEIDNISPDLCNKVFNNLQTRLQRTVEMDGKYLDGIIFKK